MRLLLIILDLLISALGVWLAIKAIMADTFEWFLLFAVTSVIMWPIQDYLDKKINDLRKSKQVKEDA